MTTNSPTVKSYRTTVPLSVSRRLWQAVALFVAVVTVSTVLLMVTTGATLFDAVYFTIITVFGVGYGETIELNRVGEMITIGVIVLGVGSFTFLTITMIEFFVEGHLTEFVGKRRMEREIERLSNHFIICGVGRVGRQAADDLIAQNNDVVLIDEDPECFDSALDHRYAPYVVGDASDEMVLKLAGLERARGVAACTDDDAENVLIALTARLANPDIFVVVRVKDSRNAHKAQQAGADRVIAPNEIGGRRIATLLTKPAVVEFLDVITHATGVDLVLEELTIRATSGLIGETLSTARLRDQYGVNVVAIRPVDGATTTRPDPKKPFAANDTLVVVGTQADMARLQQATQ